MLLGRCAVWVFQDGCWLAHVGTLAEWATFAIAALALAAAIVSATHSSSATESARRSADVAVDAFLEDARVRREAQAAKVYAFNDGKAVTAAGKPALPMFGKYKDTAIDPELFVERPDGMRVFAVNAYHARVTVTNDSDELIGPITVQAFYKGGFSVERVKWDLVLPRTQESFEIVVPLLEGIDPEFEAEAEEIMSVMPLLEFRDSAGRWWRRDGFNPIQHLDRGTYERP